jgi:NADH-quinone oxidoreductase subunit E
VSSSVEDELAMAPLSDTTRAAADALVKRYPVARSALLPLLHLVQSDQGYVTDEGIGFCAEMVGLTKAEVGAVATFYTMFKRKPVGDYLLSVCTNPTCKIAGGQDIYEGYLEAVGGHHDADAGVSVEHAECLGICDAAPVVQINYEMYGPVTRQEADELLGACRQGSPPPSNWSNEAPGTFTEVSYELSGAGDGVNDRLIAAARSQADAEVPPAYRSGETDIPVTHPGGDPKGVGGALFRERSGAARVPAHVSQEASPEEAATAADVAGEGQGVAEERSDQAVSPTPPSPATAEKATTDEPAGETPSESAGDRPTAIDETQTGRKVDDDDTADGGDDEKER